MCKLKEEKNLSMLVIYFRTKGKPSIKEKRSVYNIFASFVQKKKIFRRKKIKQTSSMGVKST